MNGTDFTIGMLVAFQMFASRMSQPMLRLVGLWQQFQQASVAVKRLSANSIEESDKRNGKVIWVGRMTVAADGKNMPIAWKDSLHGTSGSYSAVKQ